MLSLSTKGRYATRIMVNLAVQTGDKPVRKQQIAEDEGISPDYVEQLLLRLKQQGWVVSYRGAQGGFLMAVNPATVTVGNVLEAVEGPINLVGCRDDHCKRLTSCVTRKVWEKASDALLAVFREFTIEDLKNDLLAMGPEGAPTYMI